ncbi:sensor histidine kinase [Chryseobacterium sp. StRB126]|uniref:sensor histidine kinase n=1 Tax=Chryseobacterium sp. StRB126 TaxID=878220 RepID=UPI0004E98720|nr:histidine kinase [Chryseobacterium sp. StRB126]BAP31759.1 sensor histidine kinase [Chryseobacterium sp. StRB126]
MSLIKAQQISPIEREVSVGYSKRFTDSSASLKMQMAALQASHKNGNKEDEAICNAYLALTHKRLLHLKEFMKYAETSYDIANSIKSNRAKAFANTAMGYLKSYTDDKSQALTFFLKAYALFNMMQSYDQSAKLGADISYLFSPDSPEKVKKYADEGLSFAEKSGNPESILHARLAVGSYLSDLVAAGETNRWQEAVSFFNQTIMFIEKNEAKIDSKSNIGVAYINLAALYMNGPKPIDEQAFLSALEKALIIGKQYGIKSVYRSSMGLRGQYYVSKGEYRTAENLFKEGISYQQNLPYKDNYLLAAFYDCLKNIAVEEKDYKAYYEYDTFFIKYNKLKYDESTQQILQNADAKYESEKKMARIQQLEQENKLQKKNQLLGYGISAVLLIGLVFMYRSYYFRQRYHQKREDFLQQQQTNNELKMELLEKETLENLAEKLSLERRLLQSQMDPHFIFNALGNIQGMILRKDTDLAVLYLGKFAKLSRRVLEQSRMETITLEEEIQTLENYIELQQLRLNQSFDYQIALASSVDEQLHIPPLLIQPFIENAIEHGLKPLEAFQKGMLLISFEEEQEENLLICTIKDNGIGLTASRKQKTDDSHRSLSTKITDERLFLMLKDNSQAKLEVRELTLDHDGQQGCMVTLYIPIL